MIDRTTTHLFLDSFSQFLKPRKDNESENQFPNEPLIP